MNAPTNTGITLKREAEIKERVKQKAPTVFELLEELKQLREQNKALIGALEKIGETTIQRPVDDKFDEPVSARIAREALKQHGIDLSK
jgi:hypothetical protein